MRSLPKPLYDARSVFELCANNVEDNALTNRLLSIAGEIEAAEVNYVAQGENGTFFTIAEAVSVGGIVTKNEMVKLYTGTFSRQGSSVRHIYDAIKSAPRNGICPLCGQRPVSQLDHYLPKSGHPTFSVMPINLVPACSDCNKAKPNWQPTTESEQMLHPYFDQVDDEVWLTARVVETSPPCLVFSASPPDTWPSIKRNRLYYHFTELGLGRLYSSHAGAELVNIHLNLMRITERGGVEGLKVYLSEQAEDRLASEKNSWQAAMYNAISKSNWFCETGHKEIA